MSWITITWAMVISACLTLAVIHLLIWSRQTEQFAHLLFSVAATSAAAVGACELIAMHAQTTEQYGRAVWWAHIPVFFIVVSIVGFVRIYFGVGPAWLGYTVFGLRLLALVMNFFSVPSLNLKQVIRLRHVTILGGETITLPEVAGNPWRVVGQLSSLLLIVFVVEASITLWRGGDHLGRRRALIVGGSITFFVLAGAGHAALVDAGIINSPYIVSFCFLAIVAAMGYELSSDVLRSAQLARKLRTSETALRESEQQMNLAASAGELAMWMWDIPKDEIWVTNKGRALYGLADSEEINLNRFLDSLHPDDRDAVRKAVSDALTGAGEYEMEYRIVLPTGETRWIVARGRIEFEGGKPLRLRGVSLDVTERKQAEDRFRLVVEASPGGIVLVNEQGHIVLVNAQAEKLFGYGREELLGQNVELLVPERFRGKHSDHRAGFHKALAARAMGAGLELFALRKDGTEFPVEIGISPIQSKEGTLVLSVIVDISARKQAQAEARQYREELAHLSRVGIMGEISGSLAHELNQPLAAIVNNASAGRRFIAKGRAELPKLDGLFEAVIADGCRAAEIVSGIRNMVRRGQDVRGLVNLSDVITSVLRFISAEALERHCVPVIEGDPKLPLVEANPVQLQQVLLNLLVNAFDAMSETPTEMCRVIIRSERESGDRVRVSVRDFGTGLPTKEPERIFEQFFSTKHDGMGMGLAIARSIISSHGGELGAVNAKDGGACVYFWLPIARKILRENRD
ncbi:MAG: PAS domain S-box protein [Verrucomicrobia bacterium]|nr:PAS domain S-box protein [Verrucomicrobiota bacterium]